MSDELDELLIDHYEDGDDEYRDMVDQFKHKLAAMEERHDALNMYAGLVIGRENAIAAGDAETAVKIQALEREARARVEKLMEDNDE